MCVVSGRSWWRRVWMYVSSLFQGSRLEPSLMRCCHIPCGGRPIEYGVNISNKLRLDIRRHIKKYYSVSIYVWHKRCFNFFFFFNELPFFILLNILCWLSVVLMFWLMRGRCQCTLPVKFCSGKARRDTTNGSRRQIIIHGRPLDWFVWNNIWRI